MAQRAFSQFKGLPVATSLYKAFGTASASGNVLKYSLPQLPYGYGELEPAISGKIMETHHSKHHQTYVNNLNNALNAYAEAEAKGDLAKQISLQPALRFNGGGHLNHSIFWTNLAPPKNGGGVPPSGELMSAIEKEFGSFDKLKQQMSAQSVAIQGSGWGWLGYNKNNGRLEIITRANQDPLVELVPLLGIDVWEHAYYYLYGPNRAEYVNQIWTVVNWANIAQRFSNARK